MLSRRWPTLLWVLAQLWTYAFWKYVESNARISLGVSDVLMGILLFPGDQLVDLGIRLLGHPTLTTTILVQQSTPELLSKWVAAATLTYLYWVKFVGRLFVRYVQGPLIAWIEGDAPRSTWQPWD
jgi:hypothetical protein